MTAVSLALRFLAAAAAWTLSFVVGLYLLDQRRPVVALVAFVPFMLVMLCATGSADD
jgi:hypothetical protein